MTQRLNISTKAMVTVSSLISICLVVFIAITANYYITRMSENNSELYKAYHVSELIKSFRSSIIKLDGSQKRYMLTGDARFIEQYQLMETESKTLLKSIEKYFGGREQEIVFDRLRDLTYKKLTEAKELKQGGGLEGLQSINGSEEAAVKTIDEINLVIDELNAGLSQTTQTLIDNSVEYLSVSKKWNLLEIALGVLVAMAGVIILFRDINLRNQLEGELRNAKKQAEESAMMKEQFMANVSHEIRTPMNAILGFSELMGRTPLNQTQAEYLNAISASGSNLLNIINDILDFSKIEAGKLEIEKIPFSPRKQMDDLKLMFAEKARGKGIDLNVTVEERMPQSLFGDPTRLNQILVNLLSNAIKFTASGSVKLSCELKSIEHDVAQLVFRVKDTGIGIPADKLNDVFERFNQGNKETTRKYGGTGLGLSIVKSLVEIQNGSIYVKSREGQGSEFVVTLSYPVSYENAVPASRHEVPKLFPLGGKRILVVDDNVLNQKLAVTYLEGFGLKADTAENGINALSRLKTFKYDVVLMDIQMPVLDGYNTTLKIRNELKLNIPVIAMTAHVIEGEREKCINYGMNDYISKPFREAELHEMLNRYLGKESFEPGGVSAKKQNSLQLPETKVVNLRELIDLSRGNGEFIKEMIEIFLDQNPGDIAALDQAIAETDYGTIRSTAHRMKTSVGFMGLQQLVEPLNEVELLAENIKNIEAIKKIGASVKQNCVLAVEELTTVLNSLRKE